MNYCLLCDEDLGDGFILTPNTHYYHNRVRWAGPGLGGDGVIYRDAGFPRGFFDLKYAYIQMSDVPHRFYLNSPPTNWIAI